MERQEEATVKYLECKFYRKVVKEVYGYDSRLYSTFTCRKVDRGWGVIKTLLNHLVQRACISIV